MMNMQSKYCYEFNEVEFMLVSANTVHDRGADFNFAVSMLVMVDLLLRVADHDGTQSSRVKKRRIAMK